MRTIVITNQKGGCGKTTTALNLAAALAELGKRVLIVDLDPQAHATLGLGYDPDTLDKTVYHSLINRQSSISKTIKDTKIEGLDLVPSSIRLAQAELELTVTSKKEYILAEQLKKVSDKYDFCIVDCPPSLGLLTFNALVASTDIIVPVQVHYYALEGLKQLLETVKIARKRFYPCSIKILGLLLTFVEDRAALSQQVEEQMRRFFGDLVFETIIHRTISLAEAPSAGESILTYAPQSRGANEYMALAREITAGKQKQAREPEEVSDIVDRMQTTEQQLVPRPLDKSAPQAARIYDQSKAKTELTTKPTGKTANKEKTAGARQDKAPKKRFVFLVMLIILLAIAAAVIVMIVVNGPPIAQSSRITVQEDSPTQITLTANDSDRDQLVYSIVTEPSYGTLDGTAPNLTYIPQLNYNGPDSFTFQVSDGKLQSNIAEVSITVTALNDVPVANSQSVTTKMDKSVSIVLTGSDPEIDTPTFSIRTEPKNGKLSLVQNFNSGGKIVYTPSPGFTGTDSFTFRVNDGITDSEPATVSISITPNNAPTADIQQVTVSEDTSAIITLSGSDRDGDTLNYILVTNPSHGNLSGTAPNLTYTPNSNFNGLDSFTYKVDDGMDESFVATISITVTAENDAPIAHAVDITIEEDAPAPITLTGTDLDGDTLTYRILSYPSHGSVNGTAPNLIYTPDEDYNGSDSFSFRVNDGTTDSAVAKLSIEVIALDDPPIAQQDSVTLDEDKPVNITLRGSDPDGDTLTYSIVREPSNGSLSGTPPNLVYTPYENFNWLDSFTFIVNDGTTDSESAAVLITVRPANDPPIASDDEITASEDTPAIGINVLDNDVELDNEPLKISSVTEPKNGIVAINANNTLNYIPNENFHGNDSFTYTISDASGQSDTANVSVTVKNTNDAPMIVSTPINTAMLDVLYTYDVNAVDPDEFEGLTYSLLTKPEGMIIEPTTGLIQWMPTDIPTDSNEVGVLVMVKDSNEVYASDTQMFSIKINPTPPRIANLTIADVYDPLTKQTLSENDQTDVVRTSDNNRLVIRSGLFMIFDFNDIPVPSGARIKSMVIYVEHFEQENFAPGNLKWNLGTGWPDNPQTWISIDAPVRTGQQDDSVDLWDATSFVDTLEKLNCFQLQIENNDNATGHYSFVDYIHAIVEWDWPVMPDMVEYKLEPVF